MYFKDLSRKKNNQPSKKNFIFNLQKERIWVHASLPWKFPPSFSSVFEKGLANRDLSWTQQCILPSHPVFFFDHFDHPVGHQILQVQLSLVFWFLLMVLQDPPKKGLLTKNLLFPSKSQWGPNRWKSSSWLKINYFLTSTCDLNHFDLSAFDNWRSYGFWPLRLIWQSRSYK